MNYIQVEQYWQVSGIVLMTILAAYLDRVLEELFARRTICCYNMIFSFQAEFRDDPYI